jgi:hypothetical protein
LGLVLLGSFLMLGWLRLWVVLLPWLGGLAPVGVRLVVRVRLIKAPVVGLINQVTRMGIKALASFNSYI